MHRLAGELAQVKELLRNHPQGMSVTEIASALGRNKHSTGRYLDILHAAGHVDLRTFGMAKVFTLSSRVPLSALLSYTTDLVLVLDRDMRIIQGNDPFFSMLEIQGSDILQNRIEQISSPNPANDEFLLNLSRIISSKKVSFELMRGGPATRFFRGKVIPTVFDDGSSADTIILEDITLEKEALRALQESEEFFRSASDNLSDGLIVSEIKSGKKTVIFYNQRLCEITGYSAEEIHRMHPENLALPEEKERFERALKEAEQNKGTMRELRFWARRKDGIPIYLSVRVKLVPFGDLIRGYILITDITQWKEQEEAQLLQANLIKRLMSNFPHPIFILRQDGVFFIANQAFCELLKTEPDNVIGKQVFEIIPEEIAEGFLKGNDELINQKTITHQHIVTRFFRPGGSIGDVTIEKSLVSAGDNSPGYIFGIVITEDMCAH
ncbi:MAG TPA: PAS domain S-box protein [Methanospirillum sp.]|jgi:PAS domain S-box-containing protein|uniref:PAS domain S-box protein n=1 Tax=Methanospirillum sp. TaxID=45200 RepID=UPI001BD3260C|nr:PAS domain S-box protein [Methanospirillum sp.]HPY59710.1 PAS domain S-box protein [Methanospirillum sp.]